ncbi:unnamed protein product [Meganyctiphanes norvegica]|uniref:Cuticle protein n=1 Tax=Meganyctiphanes norvegica TaxID=48144 RepID=A0AAV2S779_MEGNR
MKIILALVVVGVAQCSPILKDLPANAEVRYEYDGNILEGIKIDYNDDRVVYAAPAPAAHAPAAPAVITYSAPAAPAAPASIPTYYEVDDDGDFDVATHVVYSAPDVAPVLYRLPAAPAPVPAPAPAPVVYSAPTHYYTYSSDEDDK